MSKVVNNTTRGRKVNPNSARQARLAKWNSMRESGVPVRRGRPTSKATQTEITFEVTNNTQGETQVKVIPISDAISIKLDKAMEKRSKKLEA